MVFALCLSPENMFENGGSMNYITTLLINCLKNYYFMSLSLSTKVLANTIKAQFSKPFSVCNILFTYSNRFTISVPPATQPNTQQ